MDLKGKTALVTGGAVRLGRAIALELAKAGCDIALHYGKSRVEALALRKVIEAMGQKCRLYQADLGSSKAVLDLGRDVLRDFKSVPILVNSAAIFPRVALEKARPEDFDQPYKVNLRAPALAPLGQLFRREAGAVNAISSSPGTYA